MEPIGKLYTHLGFRALEAFAASAASLAVSKGAIRGSHRLLAHTGWFLRMSRGTRVCEFGVWGSGSLNSKP